MALLAFASITILGCVAEVSDSPPLIVLDLGATTFRVEAQVAALALASERGFELAVREPRAGEGWVRLEARPPASGEALPVPVRYWALFGPFWGQVADVAKEELHGARETTLFVPLEFQAGALALLGDTNRPVNLVPASEIATTLNATSDAVALLPLDLATTRLRTLRFDGVDLYLAQEWPAALVERVWITWSGEREAAFARGLAARLRVPPPTAVRIVATGDIIPARCVYARHRARNDYTLAFQATAEYLKAADITVGSLDAALSDAGEPIGCEETFRLLAPAAAVEGLAYAGFDVVSVATNHTMDCGREPCGARAFLDTIANLKAAGIQPVGGGADQAAAHSPVLISVKGVRFAFLAYDDISGSYNGAGPSTPGTAALSAEALKEDIAAARRLADVVVVLAQWGVEYEFRQSVRQREMARTAIEAGATLVVGNHPHVLQGVEWLGDGFVAYALGNFIFDQDWSEETQQGAVLEATFVGARLVQIRLIPTRIVDMHQATWARPPEAQGVLERVRRFSYGP